MDWLKKIMYGRYGDALKGLITGWYGAIDKPVIIDKGRGWPLHWFLISSIFPDAKMIVSVRDPRDVIASIEKQHRATGIFQSPTGPTVRDSTETMMSRPM